MASVIMILIMSISINMTMWMHYSGVSISTLLTILTMIIGDGEVGIVIIDGKPIPIGIIGIGAMAIHHIPCHIDITNNPISLGAIMVETIIMAMDIMEMAIVEIIIAIIIITIMVGEKETEIIATIQKVHIMDQDIMDFLKLPIMDLPRLRVQGLHLL